MYSEGRLTRSRARSQGVGNFEELSLTSTKVRTTSRKAPGRPAFLDVTAETKNTLISEDSSTSIKNLSEEFEPRKVVPETTETETDYRASAVAGAHSDVLTEGGPLQASVPEANQWSAAAPNQERPPPDHEMAKDKDSGMPAEIPDIQGFQTEDSEGLAETVKQSSQSPVPYEQEHAAAGDFALVPEVPSARQHSPGQENKASLIHAAPEAATGFEHTDSLVVAASSPNAFTTTHLSEGGVSMSTPAPYAGPELAETPGKPGSTSTPEVPATVVARGPDAGHITADTFTPRTMSATPATAAAGSPAMVNASLHKAGAAASPARAPVASSAMSAAASPAAAMADLPAARVAASPTVVVPNMSPLASLVLPAATTASAAAALPARALNALPALSAAASPAVAMAYSPGSHVAASPSAAALPMSARATTVSSAARTAPSPTLPPAASPATAVTPSVAASASTVKVDGPKSVTPAAKGVLAAVYLNDTDSEMGDADVPGSGVPSQLRSSPGKALAAAQEAGSYSTGVVDSVYDDDSDTDTNLMSSQPRSIRGAGLPDVKTATQKQSLAAEFPQYSVTNKTSDSASIIDDMLDSERTDSPADMRAWRPVSTGRLHTAGQGDNVEDDFDRWEMDTGMDTSEGNMHHVPVPTSRLGSQVHASPSYDPRSLRQLKKEVANKLAQQAAARAQAEAEAAPLPRTPAGLYESQSDADMSPSPYQQAPKIHTEEDEKLCSALGSLDIHSASKGRQPLRGLPVPQGMHIRFDEEGQAVPSPSATQTRLRGVPAPRNSHIRFD